MGIYDEIKLHEIIAYSLVNLILQILMKSKFFISPYSYLYIIIILLLSFLILSESLGIKIYKD